MWRCHTYVAQNPTFDCGPSYDEAVDDFNDDDIDDHDNAKNVNDNSFDTEAANVWRVNGGGEHGAGQAGQCPRGFHHHHHHHRCHHHHHYHHHGRQHLDYCHHNHHHHHQHL